MVKMFAHIKKNKWPSKCWLSVQPSSYNQNQVETFILPVLLSEERGISNIGMSYCFSFCNESFEDSFRKQILCEMGLQPNMK